MAKPAIPRSDVYVYALFREDGITPFYIGMGTGRRWLIHERDAHLGDSRKDRIIKKMRAAGFTKIPKKKLAEGLTRVDAAAMEIALIASIGRAPNGPLVNHTKGGDGVFDLSPEAKAIKDANLKASWDKPGVRQRRIDGMKAVWTPEKRAEQSSSAKANMTDEVREKIRKQWDDPETLENRISSLKKYWSDPVWKAKHAAAMALVYANPEWLAKRVGIWKGRTHTEETKEKMKASSAKLMADDPGFVIRRGHARTLAWTEDAVKEASQRMLDPELRAKLDAGNRKPEVRERRIAAQKAAFATPEAKERRSQASKKVWSAKHAVKSQYALELSSPLTESHPPHSIPPPSSTRPPNAPPAELRIRNQSTDCVVLVHPSLPSLIRA